MRGRGITRCSNCRGAMLVHIRSKAEDLNDTSAKSSRCTDLGSARGSCAGARRSTWRRTAATSSLRRWDTRQAVGTDRRSSPAAAAWVPVIVTQGDADTLVPATNTRLWIDTMKEL